MVNNAQLSESLLSSRNVEMYDLIAPCFYIKEFEDVTTKFYLGESVLLLSAVVDQGGGQGGI